MQALGFKGIGLQGYARVQGMILRFKRPQLLSGLCSRVI